MNHEDFVTYEQAQQLKELGFDWKCYAYYDKRRQDGIIDRALKFQNYNYDNDYMNSVSTPTLAQVQKWLREKGKIILINVVPELKQYYWNLYDESFSFRGACNENYNTYEQALSAGIDKALELLKEQER